MNYTKKIWLDLRFLDKNNYYSQFIYELMWTFIKETPEYFYRIYLDSSFSNLTFGENTEKIYPYSKHWSIKEQTHFGKKLKKDNNDLVIFFNYKKPITFKNNYILFVPELAQFHFPSKQNIIIKHFNNILFKNSCINANKIICFDDKTKSEINDKINIPEEKINIIPPFFKEEKNIYNYDIQNLPNNVKTKYNIIWEFLIYNSWVWTEKNLSRIIEVFSLINKENKDINLVIIDNETIKSIDFRKQVITKKLTNKIFFIWNTTDFEKEFFYKNTLWIILPHLYNIFPFSLTEALKYKINILASNLNNLKNIFWYKIIYFNPNNTNDIYKKIISLKRKENNYNEIYKNNNISKTIEDLIKIVK